jgi:hypothetical protein
MKKENEKEVIELLKSEKSSLQKIMDNAVESIGDKLSDVKTECAKYYKAFVEAWHKLHSMEEVTLASLKDCKSELRPLLVEATGMSEMVLNPYMTEWSKDNDYPIANTSPTKHKCIVCGTLGAWKKKNSLGKYICNACHKAGKDTSDKDVDKDGDNTINITATSKNTRSIIITGDTDADHNTLVKFLSGLVSDKDFKVWAIPAVQQVSKMLSDLSIRKAS